MPPSGEALAVSATLYAQSLGFTLACMSYVARHRASHVMRMASYRFVLLSGLGAALVCVAGLVDTLADGSDKRCAAAEWTGKTGFALLFAPLFAKLYRVARIYSGDSVIRVRQARVSDWHLAGVVGIVLAAQVLLLAVKFADSPVRFNGAKCAAPPRGSRHGYVQLAFHAVLLYAGVALVMVTRQVDRLAAGSAHVAPAVAFTAAAVSVAKPTMLLVSGRPDLKLAVRVWCDVCIVLAVVGLETLPKALAVLTGTEREWVRARAGSSSISARVRASRRSRAPATQRVAAVPPHEKQPASGRTRNFSSTVCGGDKTLQAPGALSSRSQPTSPVAPEPPPARASQASAAQRAAPAARAVRTLSIGTAATQLLNYSTGPAQLM